MDMAMRMGGRGRFLSDINVTPMADVMIVLLIIFMVATPLMTQAPVPLPLAAHAKDRPSKPLRIVIEAAGTVVLADVGPMASSALSGYLRARVEASADPVAVVVEADARADYADVARVLEACRLAAVAEISLATRPRPAG
jgi:biopolymer transport protein ExbD